MKLHITPVKSLKSVSAPVVKKTVSTPIVKPIISSKPKITPPVLKPTTDDTYFVLIKNPLELRRQILESSKKTIYGLQSYQRLILIRHKKQLEIEKLRELVKELHYLDKKIQEYIPDYGGTALFAEKKMIRKTVLKQPETKFKSVKEKSELERLEDSLARIEEQLRALE
ncbi:MAG: hypothetical protein WC916_01160 [Candidatus Woesearchaeota archaeon]